MHPLKAAKIFSILGRSEAGVSLIETLIALGLLGAIGAAFLSGLFTVSKATILADEQAVAESVARSEIEYIQGQDYIDYSVDPHDVYDEITPPASYSIELTTTPIVPATGLPYGQTGGVFEQDQEIQKITVTIERGDKSVLIIEDYKVKR